MIHARGLTVRYGRKTAVEQVTFSVSPGAVYALLGRNGAGKSSIVRCLLGQQKPSAGTVSLFDREVWRHRARLMSRVGVVPEDGDIPPTMTARSLARFYHSLYPAWSETSFLARLESFRVPATTPFNSLSKGQKRQVALTAAVAHEPELLILDDPTLGLDSIARQELFSELIDELAERKTTVFLTTHDLAAAERIADRIGILWEGRLVLDEALEEVKSRFRKIVARDEQPLRTLGARHLRRVAAGVEGVITDFRDRPAPDMEASPMSLEEIFIAVAGEEREGTL
jgi:ABC-2 type transport system ATP-binding protein